MHRYLKKNKEFHHYVQHNKPNIKKVRHDLSGLYNKCAHLSTMGNIRTLEPEVIASR